MIKIWLDDQLDDAYYPKRKTPNDWVGCKTAMQAIRLLNKEEVSHISFDHDLGDNVLSGYIVARFIEKRAYFGRIERLVWDIHSANPVGAENIRRAMINADMYWSK